MTLHNPVIPTPIADQIGFIFSNIQEILEAFPNSLREKVPEVQEATEVLSRLYRNIFVANETSEHDVFLSELKKLEHLMYKQMQFNAAAVHFVNVSPYADNIAKAVNTTPEKVMAWSKTQHWIHLLNLLGHKGSHEVIEGKMPQRIPFPLQEDFLVQHVFQKDSLVRFVTYDGFVDASVRAVEKYEFRLTDGSTVNKIDVLLVFPKERMPHVKRGIKRRESIADLGLKPVIPYKERSKVKVLAPRNAIVECLMRNGLVVVGEVIWISKYYIVLRVGGKKGLGGKVIIVYKHALHEFRLLEAPKAYRQTSTPNDNWDNENSE